MPDGESAPEEVNLGPERVNPAWGEEIWPGPGESRPGPAGIHYPGLAGAARLWPGEESRPSRILLIRPSRALWRSWPEGGSRPGQILLIQPSRALERSARRGAGVKRPSREGQASPAGWTAAAPSGEGKPAQPDGGPCRGCLLTGPAGRRVNRPSRVRRAAAQPGEEPTGPSET
jgi:hypothetical protein